MSIRRSFALAPFLLAFVLSAGCGDSTPTTGEVSEKAKMKEKMPPSGAGAGGGGKSK